MVPYIIEYPQISLDSTIKYNEDLRCTLEYDNNMIVLGRHGDLDTWNLHFVSEVIKYILAHRNDIAFLFLNTKPFVNHPRVHFMEGTSSPIKLEQYFWGC